MTIRVFWVWVHRWTGLFMAGFLIVVALTGSLLAFWLEINHWLTPELYPGERPGVALDAATLAQRAETILPNARVTGVYLGYPGSAMISVEPRDGAPELDFEFLHLDTINGHERGRVTWHSLPRRKSDIMPFVYGLHMYLAMAGVGDWILGAVALMWTLDCFVGFYLTLPPPAGRARKSFLSRWACAFKIKRGGSFYRLNFDLHRAGGLWLWPLLFVFAWSGVYFLLPSVYAGVTGRLFDYSSLEPPAAVVSSAASPASMDFAAAQEVGRRLMAEQASQKGFAIERPVALTWFEDQGLYEYRIHSSRDIGDRGGATAVFFDSRSGELKRLKLPSGERRGDTLTTWLVELHTANVFGLHYRIFVSALGLCVAGLSVTGVYIWWKKRSARLAHQTVSKEARGGLIGKSYEYT